MTRHLLANPVFSCITLAACMEIAVVAGFAAFLGKYLEQQFNLTTSSANQLLGRQLTAYLCFSSFTEEENCIRNWFSLEIVGQQKVPAFRRSKHL